MKAFCVIERHRGFPDAEMRRTQIERLIRRGDRVIPVIAYPLVVVGHEVGFSSRRITPGKKVDPALCERLVVVVSLVVSLGTRLG